MPSFRAFAEFQKRARDQKKIEEEVPLNSDQKKADDSGPTQAAPEFRIGVRVKVQGLEARPELNDLVGTLTAFDEQRERWQVELDNGQGGKLFKAANLGIVDTIDASTKPVAKVDSIDASTKSVTFETEPGKPNTRSAAGALARREEDDEEAFARSIEQCLKECGVMWDEY